MVSLLSIKLLLFIINVNSASDTGYETDEELLFPSSIYRVVCYPYHQNITYEEALQNADQWMQQNFSGFVKTDHSRDPNQIVYIKKKGLYEKIVNEETVYREEKDDTGSRCDLTTEDTSTHFVESGGKGSNQGKLFKNDKRKLKEKQERDKLRDEEKILREAIQENQKPYIEMEEIKQYVIEEWIKKRNTLAIDNEIKQSIHDLIDRNPKLKKYLEKNKNSSSSSSSEMSVVIRDKENQETTDHVISGFIKLLLPEHECEFYLKEVLLLITRSPFAWKNAVRKIKRDRKIKKLSTEDEDEVRGSIFHDMVYREINNRINPLMER